MKALDWLIVDLSFRILERPRFPVKRRGDGFAAGLCSNIEKLGLGEDIESKLQACAIAASSRGQQERERICGVAFEILDDMRIPPRRVSKKKVK